MKKRFCISFIIVILAIVSIGIAEAVRHDDAMHSALSELQSRNQDGTFFRSDKEAIAIVNYFDHFWHSSNDRMLAYYLLGRTHADMGEAPQAITDYLTAVQRADTTDGACDFRILRNIYGQMAEVFEAQDLAEDEIQAQMRFNHLSLIIGDSIEALNGFRRLERPLYLLGKYQQILENNAKARVQLLEIGDTLDAAQTLITPAYIHIQRQDFTTAGRYISIIRQHAGIFDGDGCLLKGNEVFYYTMGCYYGGINQLDSAEHFFRRVLENGELEAGYKGLLSVYEKRKNADSIAKFARLFADANDAYYDSLRTAEVHKTAALYNYNRYLTTANEERFMAQQRLKVIYMASIIILALVILCYVLYSRSIRKDQKRQQALNTVRTQYIEVHAAYIRLKNQIDQSSADRELLEQKIQELHERENQLKIMNLSLKEKNKIGYYYSHEIVQGMIDAAINVQKPSTVKSFLQLRHLFTDTFPHFADFVTSTHPLTDIEWYVCILMDLGLSNGDIAFLTGYSTSRISNVKVQVSRILFHETSSISLSKKLREQIHPRTDKV